MTTMDVGGTNINMNMTLNIPIHGDEEMMICNHHLDLPRMADGLESPSNSSKEVSGSFVTKLFAMVETEPDSVITWIREGTAFHIVQPKVLADTYLPKYFRHGRFSSLIRQLNFYSFYKVTEANLIIYQHSHFRQGRPDLLVHIKRRGAGKAKDPFIDPLSLKDRSSVCDLSAVSIVAPVNVKASSKSSTDLCSSPLSKPLSASHVSSLLMNDNMSPALKPSSSPHMVPPVVDLSGRKDVLSCTKNAFSRTHHVAMTHAKNIYGTGLGFHDKNFSDPISSPCLKPQHLSARLKFAKENVSLGDG
jgi:hypothetical protein